MSLINWIFFYLINIIITFRNLRKQRLIYHLNFVFLSFEISLSSLLRIHFVKCINNTSISLLNLRWAWLVQAHLQEQRNLYACTKFRIACTIEWVMIHWSWRTYIFIKDTSSCFKWLRKRRITQWKRKRW